MAEALLTELTHQSITPPGGDERIAAFSKAVLHLSEQQEIMSTLLDDYSEHRTVVASYAANLLLRSLQKQLIVQDRNYPYDKDYTVPSVWVDTIEEVIHNPQRLSELRRDLFEKDVQSNVVERYKAFKLAACLLSSMLDEGARVLDIGCSRNHGLKKLKLNLPFTPIACGAENADPLPYAVLNHTFNWVIGRPLNLGKCTGTDIVPIIQGEDSLWAKSCSFYPSELTNKLAVREYDYLESVDVPGVEFVQGDFTRDGLGESHSDRKYDIITASTFMYQLNAEEQNIVRKQLRNNLSKDGVIVYQDFVTVSDDGQQLEFEPNWFGKEYPYRTIIEFGADEPTQLYELLRWQNGRCATWIPGKDIGLVMQR